MPPHINVIPRTGSCFQAELRSSDLFVVKKNDCTMFLKEFSILHRGRCYFSNSISMVHWEEYSELSEASDVTNNLAFLPSRRQVRLLDTFSSSPRSRRSKSAKVFRQRCAKIFSVTCRSEFFYAPVLFGKQNIMRRFVAVLSHLFGL